MPPLQVGARAQGGICTAVSVRSWRTRAWSCKRCLPVGGWGWVSVVRSRWLTKRELPLLKSTARSRGGAQHTSLVSVSAVRPTLGVAGAAASVSGLKVRDPGFLLLHFEREMSLPPPCCGGVSMRAGCRSSLCS